LLRKYAPPTPNKKTEIGDLKLKKVNTLGDGTGTIRRMEGQSARPVRKTPGGRGYLLGLRGGKTKTKKE